MKGKSIFVTGATGFIGRRLVCQLAKNNTVIALVRSQSVDKVRDFDSSVKLIAGDLLDNNSYSQQLCEVDYVFHLAAAFRVDGNRDSMYETNVLGTQRLLDVCVGKNNIKKIVHFSTAYVSGTQEGDFISENLPYPSKFKNWYEWSKAESEKVVITFSKNYNLRYCIIRPVIVYGPGSFYGFYDAMQLIADGKLLAIPGNGRNRLHLVHVDDVVNATLYLAGLKNNLGEIYHICDSFPYTCLELIHLTCRQLNVRSPLLTTPRWLVRLVSKLPVRKIFFGNICSQLLDYFLFNQTYSNAKLDAAGYSFKFSKFIDGLCPTVEWYRENNKTNFLK